MSRSTPIVFCLMLAACSRKPATVAADSTTVRTSVGIGSSLVVPQFIGTWTRPAGDQAGLVEAMVLERGGGLKFLNVCTMRGVSWAGIPGDSLALVTTVDHNAPPAERHFHLQRFTDSLLAIEGNGYEAGSWVRGPAPVEKPCPNP